eukprot:354615-Chlamydomonas_euryale.AAC.1
MADLRSPRALPLPRHAYLFATVIHRVMPIRRRHAVGEKEAVSGLRTVRSPQSWRPPQSLWLTTRSTPQLPTHLPGRYGPRPRSAAARTTWSNASRHPRHPRARFHPDPR